MAASDTTDELLAMMRGMTAADLSVVAAASEMPDAAMTTMPGSANDTLWSKMTRLGWLNVETEEIPVEGSQAIVLRGFTMTAVGTQPIAGLLQRLRQG